MRCLALAEPWRQAGGTVTLISAELPKMLAERARALDIEVCRLDAAPGTHHDAAVTIVLARELRAKWAVIDGYHFIGRYQRLLKDAGLRLLAFDDNGHADHYCADFVLNQNLGAPSTLYPNRDPHTRLLLGPRFVQLRDEFLGHPRTNARGDGRAPRLLVTLGGSDPDNATAKVLAALRQIPSMDATVVVGGSSPHSDSLATDIWHPTSNIRLVRDASNMPELMAQADLAICAGGTTAWELCFMGVPMLVLTLADNQRANSEQLAKAGVARNLGWHSEVTPDRIAGELKSLLAVAPARTEMSRRASTLVDGHGTFRVWLRMNEDTLHLRPATADDCRRVWEWANDPVVRAVSFSSETIPWASHAAWFSQKLSDANCRLWIAEEPEQIPRPATDALQPVLENSEGRQDARPALAVGQVRFDLESHTATISVGLDVRRRGKNLGALLIWSACQKLFRESAVEAVHALIKPDNAASIRAFKKAGFEPAGEAAVKGCVALKFVLQRERAA